MNPPDRTAAGALPVPPLPAGTRPGAYHAIVIGAGLGGLTTAALLAKRGYKVLVIEQHSRPGGSCASWTRRVDTPDGPHEFVFDAGVQDISGLGANRALRGLLDEIGIANRIAWKRMHHLYWYNGIAVKAGHSTEDFVAALCRQFPHEAVGIAQLFAEIDAVRREIYADGIPSQPQAGALQAWVKASPHIQRWLRRPFCEMLAQYVSDAALRGILGVISEYITEDIRQPYVQEMAPLYGYYAEGGHYPAGGAQTLSDTLAAAVGEHGGEIRYSTKVQRIVIEHGRVAGVATSDGTQIAAPIVVANGDVVATLTKLIDPGLLPARYAKRIAQLAPGPSAIVVNLGLSTIMPLPERVFVVNNGCAFGFGNPSVADETLAPPGHSALTILWLMPDHQAAPWLDKSLDQAGRKAEAAETLIQAIETSVFPDIRKHIVFQQIASPSSFVSFTGARNGAIYGAACGAWRPALQSPIPGLLLVGAGTETGPGVEAVVISGTRAANLVSSVPIKDAPH